MAAVRECYLCKEEECKEEKGRDIWSCPLCKRHICNDHMTSCEWCDEWMCDECPIKVAGETKYCWAARSYYFCSKECKRSYAHSRRF